MGTMRNSYKFYWKTQQKATTWKTYGSMQERYSTGY